MGEVEFETRTEIARQPKEIEPPHRISEELAKHETPSLPVSEETPPWKERTRRCWHWHSAAPVRHLLRFAILHRPPDNPRNAEYSGNKKGSAPAEMQGNPRH